MTIFISILTASWHTLPMTAYIRALRAITATVFQRVYRPLVWVIGGILLTAWIVLILLGSQVSAWWFILLIVFVPLTIIVVGIAIVLWLLSQRLFPRHLAKEERVKILQFSDKLLRVAELRATPMPLMVAMIAKDLVRGKKSSYIEGVITDSTSLKHDFVAIRDLFV